MSYAFISRYYRGNYYYDLLTEFISYLFLNNFNNYYFV